MKQQVQIVYVTDMLLWKNFYDQYDAHEITHKRYETMVPKEENIYCYPIYTKALCVSTGKWKH